MSGTRSQAARRPARRSTPSSPSTRRASSAKIEGTRATAATSGRGWRCRIGNSSRPGRRAPSSLVEGLQQSAQIQKELFAVAVERGRVASRLAAENVESISKAVAGVTAVLDTVAGYTTSAQKQALELAAAQSATVYDAAKQQFEASGSAAADTFKRGINTIIETQRTVLGARDAG